MQTIAAPDVLDSCFAASHVPAASACCTSDLYNQNLYGRIPWEAIGELSSGECGLCLCCRAAPRPDALRDGALYLQDTKSTKHASCCCRCCCCRAHARPVIYLWLDGNPSLAQAEPPNTLDPTLPAKMPGLESFWFTSAGLVGSIPDSFGSLVNLTQLAANDNRLAGPIPSSLARCTKLQLFWVQDNNLTAPAGGWAPWGGMSGLEFFNLLHNPIGGTLDAFPWRNWTSLKVLKQPHQCAEAATILHATVHLSINLLWCWCLQDVRLATSRLTGTVPPEIAAAAKLETLELQENELTGDLTPAIRAWSSSLKALTWLNLGENKFDSVVSSTSCRAGLCALLHACLRVKLARMQLQPLCVPLTAVGLLPTAHLLSVQLPPEIGGLTALEVFYAVRAGLKGPLPETLANARNLSFINLASNALTGDLTPAIRAWSGKLTKLVDLTFTNNTFSSVVSVHCCCCRCMLLARVSVYGTAHGKTHGHSLHAARFSCHLRLAACQRSRNSGSIM